MDKFTNRDYFLPAIPGFLGYQVAKASKEVYNYIFRNVNGQCNLPTNTKADLFLDHLADFGSVSKGALTEFVSLAFCADVANKLYEQRYSEAALQTFFIYTTRFGMFHLSKRLEDHIRDK